MFTIAEIAKTFITEHFTPLTSWVYSKQVTLTQAEIDSSYWVAWGGTIDYNQENRAISSVYLDFILNLSEMDNLIDCQGQEESFYFDSVNQVLYIHVTHTENPFAQAIETGLLFGYCSDKVRYFGNQEYKPILLSIPTISQNADPLQYDIMAFSGGSVVLSNDGEFDTFEKLYGNTIRLKIGKEGDDYTDLITIFSGYIKDYMTTTKDITIDIGDNREKLQIEYPTQVFDALTGQAEDSNGQIIPDGYGTVIQVPAYPSEIGAGDYELTFDGDNDYCTIPAMTNLATLTVEMKVYFNALADVWLINKRDNASDNQWQLIYYGGTLSLDLFGGSSSPVASVSYTPLYANRWYSLAFTTSGVSGSTAYLFVDGVAVNSAVLSGNMKLGSLGITIGAQSWDYSSGNHNGKIKDVRIWDIVRSGVEILANKDAVFTGSETGLIAYYKMDEGTGTTVTDSVGSNNGTISGASWVMFSGVRFKWGTSVTSITQVYVEKDDKISSVSHSGFTNSGLFLLSDADAYQDGDNTKGLRKVYVTGVMRNLTNPADIIVDLNSRLANIQYNSTNYNLAEWESEKTALADVSLYMGDSKSLYDWISLLQSGSTWGFRYEDSGKRTIRRDDPDRATITFDDGTTIITPVEIRNSDIPIDQNAELYATSCIVKYGYNHRTQSYSQVENTDYKDAVLQEHRIEKILTIESLLTNKTDAEAKALRIMQDQSQVRPIITLELEVSKCTTPRIYDMIEAQVSLLTRESRIPSVWTYVLGDLDILGDDLGLIGEVHKLTRTEAYTKNGSRLYFGELKGQIIGIEPRTDTDSVVLRIRERD